MNDLLSKVERCHIDASAEIDEDDKVDEEEMHVNSQCENCKAAQQSPEYEKVTPTKISKWSFEVQLEGEGTYECSATGLVFEVSEQALVQYSVLSWFQFSEFLQDSWRPAGSIYDVKVKKDPSVLKFIHFPHSLCLAEPEHEPSFSVLHVNIRHPFELTVDFTASHVKWRVTSLSPVGPIIPRRQHVKHHALVLIYQELNKYHEKIFTFHVYLVSNNDSEIKAIEEQVLKSTKKWIKIDKPDTCTLEEKVYHLTSKPEGTIEPWKLGFTTEVLPRKHFSEAYFGERPPFRLFLKDSVKKSRRNCEEPLWSATIREGDVNCEEFISRKIQVANIGQKVLDPLPMSPAAGEGTSDLQSSPHLSLEHPPQQATSSTTSSPPAPSRATQAEGGLS
ncbi:unnamed protein product [Arctogadus glacialis]